MQSLPLRRRLRRMWRLRRWLDRHRSPLGGLRRLLCIMGPLPLVLGSALSARVSKSRDLLAEFAIDSAIFLFRRTACRPPWAA